MKEYKTRRGETLEERIPDMEATVEDYSGPVTGTEELKDSNLYVVGESKNSMFTRIIAGVVKYGDKKDKLAVNLEEVGSTDPAPEDLEAAGEAVSAKNDSLLEATSCDAKFRCDLMRRVVEDDVPNV